MHIRDAGAPMGRRGRLQRQPAHVLGSLASWTATYGLPVWLAGDHAMASRFVERHLYQCYRHITSERGAAATVCGAGKSRNDRYKGSNQLFNA